tara:strand:+ start:664 stop:1014 length:351 start_codon:yes stop_codon:yes gene_type:complete
MANEITITAKIKATNGELVVPESGVVRQSINQTTQGYMAAVEAIGTNEALVLGDIANPGWAYFKNLDATDSIYIGLTGSYSIELQPGEVAMFRCKAALYAASSANTPKLQYIIFED